MPSKKLAIVGGGASGLAAACVASELSFTLDEAQRPEIVLYEATDKVGRPILRSGNGRCNFSNSRIDPSLYRNSEFVQSVLKNVGDKLSFYRAGDEGPSSNPVLDFFTFHGAAWREESDGRLYPQTNKASTILNPMLKMLDHNGVDIVTDCKIEQVDEPSNDSQHLTMRTSDGEFVRTDAIIYAVGGISAEGQGIGFLPRRDTECTLGPIKVQERSVKALDNIRVRCAVSLISKDGEEIAKEQGEIIFRKYGVSGIAIFNLSRHMQSGCSLRIDVMGEHSLDDVIVLLQRKVQDLSLLLRRDPTNAEMLQGIVLDPIAKAMLQHVDLDSDASVGSADVDHIAPLAKVLKDWRFTCSGIGDDSICQVMSGGYDISAIDPMSMECFGVPQLYVTGEALDVDAPCGGYNLHWAFATGMLAGLSAMEKLAGRNLSTLRS